MSRQRIVNDSFWECPDLDNYTVECRLTLLLALTNRFSNIIGIYRVNFRTLGAGLGWTLEQTLAALLILQDLGGVKIDEEKGWVWVFSWWKHNNLKAAFIGNVSKKAREQVAQVPEFWREDVLAWFQKNDPDGVLKGVLSPLGGVSEGLSSPSKGAAPNTKTISKSTTTTTTTGKLEPEKLVFSKNIQDSENLRVAIAENFMHFDHVVVEKALDELANALQTRKIGNNFFWLEGTLRRGVVRTPGGLKKFSQRMGEI